MLRKNLLFLLSTLWLASGCVKDDMSGCEEPGVDPRLHFTYTLNKDGRDKLAEAVKYIKLYVFDQNTGVLVDTIRVSADDIARGYIDPQLPDGKYTMVAWAGSSTDLIKGGFKDGQASSADPSNPLPLTLGTTTINDFRMMLSTNPPAAVGGDASPKVQQFDDLFYAIVRDVTIKNGKSDKSINFNLVKNSSLLNIHITGVQHVKGPKPLRVFVVGKNGSLLYDDTIDPNAQSIRYEPFQTNVSRADDPNIMDVRIKTLRLDMSKESSQPVLLYIQDGNRLDVVAPINVVSAIRKITDANGNTPYQTQGDIDREDEFRIDIVLSPSADGSSTIVVTVNGFRPESLLPS